MIHMTMTLPMTEMTTIRENTRLQKISAELIDLQVLKTGFRVSPIRGQLGSYSITVVVSSKELERTTDWGNLREL